MPQKQKPARASSPRSALVPIAAIEKRIYVIRGQKVMLDRDLAELYGVRTMALKQPPNSVTGVAPAAPTADWQQAQAAPVPVPAQPGPTPQAAVVAPSAPPPPQVEYVPVAPGPYYVWAPGYWSWNGGWVWVGGRYMSRPRPGAVWVGGHWGRHGHGYVWIGGGWR